MSITIVSSKTPSLIKKEIDDWKQKHNNYEVLTEFENIDNSSQSLLFGEIPDILLIVEDAHAHEVRKLLDYPSDILIVSLNKPRANFKKDGISVIDKTKPSKKELIDFAKSRNINKNIYSVIYSQIENVPSAISMIEQMSFIDNNKNYRKGDLYDVYPSDLPPWDITEAIISGDVKNSLNSLDIHLSKFKKKSDIISLNFQVCGYFKKVIAAKNDTGNIASNFFFKKAKSIKDLNGLSFDLSYYPTRILNSQHPDIVMKSMIASMTSRF